MAATEIASGELLAADLSGLDLVALVIDRCTSVSTCARSRLGSPSTTRGICSGRLWCTTENATVVTDLLTGLHIAGERRQRRLDNGRDLCRVRRLPRARNVYQQDKVDRALDSDRQDVRSATGFERVGRVTHGLNHHGRDVFRASRDRGGTPPG